MIAMALILSFDVYDLAGRSFADSPEWTANIGATYTADSGLFTNISANYASTSAGYINPYVRVDKDGERMKPGHEFYDVQNHSRTLVNMQVGYEWDAIGVYVIARNIFDEEYLEFNGTETITIGQPQQVSFSVRGSF